MMTRPIVLVAVTDLEGGVVAWNRALAELTGCAAAMASARICPSAHQVGVRDLADIMGQVAYAT